MDPVYPRDKRLPAIRSARPQRLSSLLLTRRLQLPEVFHAYGIKTRKVIHSVDVALRAQPKVRKSRKLSFEPFFWKQEGEAFKSGTSRKDSSSPSSSQSTCGSFVLGVRGESVRYKSMFLILDGTACSTSRGLWRDRERMGGDCSRRTIVRSR